MNILILNVHSGLNLGDDAIMQTTIHGLATSYPGADITVAANDPDSWGHYNEISVVSSLCTWVADCRMGKWRSRLYLMPVCLVFLFAAAVLYRLFGVKLRLGNNAKRQLLDAFYGADLVLSCGGGNFYAHHGASPALFWAFATLAFPLSLGKKVAMLPQSVGPIEGGFQRFLARAVLRHVRIIMVREPISKLFIRETLRLDQVKIQELPDLAFGLLNLPSPEMSQPLSSAASFSLGITIIDRAAQNPLFTRQQIYEDAIASAAKKLIDGQNAASYLFVQCYGPSPDQDDRLLVHRFARRLNEFSDSVMVLDSFTDSKVVKAYYGHMDCVIATRMHTAVFALLNKVPVILIGYQQKSQGLMETFGLHDYYCDIDEITPDRLIDMVEKALSNRHEIEKQISAQLDAIQPRLLDWSEHLLAL